MIRSPDAHLLRPRLPHGRVVVLHVCGGVLVGLQRADLENLAWLLGLAAYAVGTSWGWRPRHRRPAARVRCPTLVGLVVVVTSLRRRSPSSGCAGAGSPARGPVAALASGLLVSQVSDVVDSQVDKLLLRRYTTRPPLGTTSAPRSSPGFVPSPCCPWSSCCPGSPSCSSVAPKPARLDDRVARRPSAGLRRPGRGHGARSGLRRLLARPDLCRSVRSSVSCPLPCSSTRSPHPVRLSVASAGRARPYRRLGQRRRQRRGQPRPRPAARSRGALIGSLAGNVSPRCCSSGCCGGPSPRYGPGVCSLARCSAGRRSSGWAASRSAVTPGRTC